MEPCLYIVATPIGNLDDITIRAQTVLSDVDVIAAEDTRHTKRLLQHLDIKTPIRAYHDFSSDTAALKLLKIVEDGGSVALVSDAGTPLISDPGYALVKAAHEQGIKVSPIPGASAVTAILSAAGLPSDRFSFEGFLPAKNTQRFNSLQGLLYETRTMVFYEAPHRIVESLKTFIEVFGAEREATIGRELTKTFETISNAKLGELLELTLNDSNQQRGEFVIVLKGYKAAREDVSEEAKRLMGLLEKEMPPKKAAKIAAEYTGDSSKLIYQWRLTNSD